jgi:excisionase family DNA binding protein
MTATDETMAAFRRGGLLTPNQAAGYLGVPVETLRHWRNARTGPDYLRVGRHCRYRFDALEAWITAQTVDARTGQQVAPLAVDRHARLRRGPRDAA